MIEPNALVDGYDAALFDLDGVVYLGPEPVPGAADGLARLRRRDVTIGFVTNNAARPPVAVARHLVDLGIDAQAEDIVTAAQAGAALLGEHVPAGAPVLVVGTEALATEVRRVGLRVVTRLDQHPVAVIQGYDPQLQWSDLSLAAHAIQRGALWVATNTDSTRPTDLGLVPGNGAAVAVVGTAVDREPLVAGKPYRPLMEATLRRTGAAQAIFVGDRLDTDVAGAVAVGIDSLFVLTGAHGLADLVEAGPDQRPTHLGADLSALLDPARRAELAGDEVRCGRVTASVREGAAVLTGDLDTDEALLDGAWALAQLAWQYADAGHSLDCGTALAACGRIR
ncbi:MAG: HAD-IIA family hydrolase [Propionibacteriaceae bacterium]